MKIIATIITMFGSFFNVHTKPLTDQTIQAPQIQHVEVVSSKNTMIEETKEPEELKNEITSDGEQPLPPRKGDFSKVNN